MKERRKLERYKLRVPTTVELPGVCGQRETLQLETKDISAEGAFLTTPQLISEGAHLKLEMILSVEKLRDLIGANKMIELRMEGTVIRKDPSGIAVLFDKKYQIKALNHHHPD